MAHFDERGWMMMFGLVPFGTRNDLAKRDDALDRLFDIFREPFFSGGAPLRDWGGMAAFKVDVKDDGEAYELTADLPGMKKEDISLCYENSYLTIAARQEEKKEEQDEKGRYIRRERSLGSMSRSFYIDDIDEAKISAEFQDGVLKVVLPKAAPAERKAIEIR